MKKTELRTMEYLGEDFWGNVVYKCVETGTLWKDINMGNGEPDLHSCGNEFDGEPCYPIKKDLRITFIGVPERPSREEKFNYMMLSRLQQDCNYYLGYGNRCSNHLWAGNERDQIEKMKALYNSFSDDKKPEWLTWEQILIYENQMVA